MPPGSNGVEGNGSLSYGEEMEGGNGEVHIATEGQAATESLHEHVRDRYLAIGRRPIGPSTPDFSRGERVRCGGRAPVRNGVAPHSPSTGTGRDCGAVASNDQIAHAIITQASP